MIVNEIISRAQQAHIQREEARVIAEKMERQRLRALSNAGANSMSDLLKKLAGEEDTDSMPKLQLNNEAANVQPSKRENSFPPPPTGPAPSSSGPGS